MINVLVPCMGKSVFYKDSFFPKMLYEVNGETLLEAVVHNYSSLNNHKMIFVFGDEECKKFHLDDSARILTGPNGKAIVLKHETKGALCTCLMAYPEIDNEDALIICNSDQVIDIDFNEVITYFESRNADAGVIIFDSIHPRWSYARIVDDFSVVELAEKRPLSNHAIAGFYYFRHGKDFLASATQAILKENNTDGIYYISASLNELILMNKSVVAYQIDKRRYHSFYAPEKIKDYEKELQR